jgi:hypothetical protein
MVMESSTPCPTPRALDAGDAQRSRAWAGRCSLDAHSPNLRQTFFWLDGFAVPAPAQVPREEHAGQAANRWAAVSV